ncbi:MAG: ester cyclase [Bacteroidetes bacterium]|nr:ester cyclase [Bacteroidota bacterium]MCW5895590.1 ester cyclase [Bacteroidota bacterium]
MKLSIHGAGRNCILFVMLPAAILWGCQHEPDYSKELKPLVDKYNEVWQTGNVDELDAIFDSRFMRHSDIATSVEGLEHLKVLISDFREAYPDLKLVSLDEVYVKDRFAGRWSLTAASAGLQVWGVHIIHFANGKITEEWDAYDNLPFMAQRGYTITPPGQL